MCFLFSLVPPLYKKTEKPIFNFIMSETGQDAGTDFNSVHGH